MTAADWDAGAPGARPNCRRALGGRAGRRFFSAWLGDILTCPFSVSVLQSYETIAEGKTRKRESRLQES